MDLPDPGVVVWAEPLGPSSDTRCRIEGRDDSVTFEYSRVPSIGPRRVHLVREVDRSDSLAMQAEARALRPADAPTD